MSQDYIEKKSEKDIKSESQDLQVTPSSSIEKNYTFDQLNDIEETEYNPNEVKSSNASSQKPTKKQIIYQRFRKLFL